MVDERFKYLFDKYVDNTASERELDELFQLCTSVNNNAKLDRLLREMYLKSFEEVDSSFVDIEKDKILAALRKSCAPSKSRVHIKRIIYTTAAACLLIFMGFYFLTSDRELIKEGIVDYQDIPAGGDKAMLILGNGNHVLLDTLAIGNSIWDGQMQITKLSNGQISYEVNGGESLTDVYNNVETPTGGNFQVVLPDGTKVWLNALSRLKYPLNFGPKERRIELQGEAYVEVAKNAKKPFIIDLPKGKGIKVLGTHFNINTYNRDKQITTVTEGKVQVKGEGGSEIVEGNQQLIFDRQHIQLLKENVNMEQALAWKNGSFSVHSISLHDLMSEVERWYGVQVKLEDGDDVEFVIRLRKDISLRGLIKLLELTKEVKFELNNKTLKVMKIKKI